MKKIAGGTEVSEGYYLNVRRWALVPVAKGGGRLPGGAADAFVQLSTSMVLALTPVLGGLFVVFLPVIGFVLVAQALVRRGDVEGEVLAAEAEPS